MKNKFARFSVGLCLLFMIFTKGDIISYGQTYDVLFDERYFTGDFFFEDGNLIQNVDNTQKLIISNENTKTKENINLNYTVSNTYKPIENLRSNFAVVIDLENKSIIRGKNYNAKMYPASMTKIMTAILAIESNLDLNSRYTIDQGIIDYCNKNDLSMSGFTAGDNPRLIDLLYGAMLESGGESCIAIANLVGGNVDNFVSMMNQKASQLGLVNTHFSNPIGFTDANHYSTAEEIAKLLDYSLNNELFKKIVLTKSYEAENLNASGKKRVLNNKLLENVKNIGVNPSYILGGKTGYTDAAGLCLASFGVLNNRNYIVVTGKAAPDSTTQRYNIIDTNNIYLKSLLNN